MNRPLDPRALGATTTALPARREGYSNLELVLLLGVLVSSLVGARIDLQEGASEGGVEPQAQGEALEERAVEPELTKEEQNHLNHLTVMVKLQESALANIDQLTPSQRAAHDAMETEDERLSFLVKLEIERVSTRGKLLREGLGERGSELFGTLSGLPAERRNGHMRKLKNTLANEYRGSIEKFGDEADLDERRVKNAQKARARGRRVQWLAEFEQKRLREMRGSGKRPAGMDQATYDQLIAEEDPQTFLRGLNSSRLDPPSGAGDARDSGTGGNAKQLSPKVDASNNAGADSKRDASSPPVAVKPSAGATQGANPGRKPGSPAAESKKQAEGAERKGAQDSQRKSDSNDKAVESAGAHSPGQPDQRAESPGGSDDAQTERMTAMESLEAAQKLGQILDTAPTRTREWAEAIGGGVDAEQLEERLQQYNERVAPLRDLIADSGLTPELRKQYRVDEIHDLHLVVTVLGSGGVDVQRDVAMLAQIAEVEQRNAQRAKSGSAAAPPGRGAEGSAAASEAQPSAASEDPLSAEPLSLSESRKAANELARILDTVPTEAGALAAALGGGVDSDDAQERFAGYREKAERLRELIEQSSLTQELREQLQIDRMQDEVLVVTVLGSGGVDVGRDVTLLDQLAVAEFKRSARESAEQQEANSAEDAAVTQGTQPVGDELSEEGVSGGEPDGNAETPESEDAPDPSLAKLRVEAEQERKALLKQLKDVPAVALALAEYARFTEDDLERTGEMPPSEGLRERYSLAAERVVREALKAELMSLDLVDSLLQYEPGFLPLTVRQAAGEDVGRELKRLRQLSAEANADDASKQAEGASASEVQPEAAGEAPAKAPAESEADAAAAEPAAPKKKARTGAAGEQAQGRAAQPKPKGKPLPGLTVDDHSPDIELPPRTGVAPTGEGRSGRDPGTPVQKRKRLSQDKQGESRAKRQRSGGTSSSRQNPSEKPAPEGTSGAGKPKGSGRRGPGGPAGRRP